MENSENQFDITIITIVEISDILQYQRTRIGRRTHKNNIEKKLTVKNS